MLITIYRSTLCPRCSLARKYLHEISSKQPEIQVKDVDVLRTPVRTWQDGIRMIPALKIDNHILSGIFLSRDKISNFIANPKS